MPTPNGLTVTYQGQSISIDLNERNAERFAHFADNVQHAPPSTDRPISKEEIARRVAMSKGFEQEASMFRQAFSRLADLDEHHLAYVLAYINLVKWGNGPLSGSNWVLEIITRLLHETQCEGAAKVNEDNPVDVLARIAHDIGAFWNWIDNCKRMVERHSDVITPKVSAPSDSATGLDSESDVS